MHYSNLLIIRKEEDLDLEQAVARAMGPREDQGGFWDWYQIGGRWTGALSNYDPTKDPENIEICNICGGTGFRQDDRGRRAREQDPSYTCNGCGRHDGRKWSHGEYGPGRRLKWPTLWSENPGDAVPIEKVEEENYRFYRVITPYGRFEKERYVPWAEGVEKKFQEQELPPLQWLKDTFPGHLAVVVDNHC